MAHLSPEARRAAVLFTAPLALVLGTYGLFSTSVDDPIDGIISTFLIIAAGAWIAVLPAQISSEEDDARTSVSFMVAAGAMTTAQAAVLGAAAYWVIFSTLSNLRDPIVLFMSLMVVPLTLVASMLLAYCIGSTAKVEPRTVLIILALQSMLVFVAFISENGPACLVASGTAMASALLILRKRHTPR